MFDVLKLQKIKGSEKDQEARRKCESLRKIRRKDGEKSINVERLNYVCPEKTVVTVYLKEMGIKLKELWSWIEALQKAQIYGLERCEVTCDGRFIN